MNSPTVSGTSVEAFAERTYLRTQDSLKRKQERKGEGNRREIGLRRILFHLSTTSFFCSPFLRNDFKAKNSIFCKIHVTSESSSFNTWSSRMHCCIRGKTRKFATIERSHNQTQFLSESLFSCETKNVTYPLL